MITKFRAVSAAAVGRGHSKRGEACADAVGTSCLGRYSAIAVLADGAGSAKYGVHAAQMAVKETIGLLENVFHSAGCCTTSTLKNGVLDVASRLEEAALRKGASITDYGTTLLVAYAQITRGGLYYCIAHVGDGCIVAASETADQVLSEPKRGEHANETYFLTRQNVEKRAHFVCGTLDLRYGLILMSDGAASCLYDYRQRCAAPGCRRISYWARRLKKSKLERTVNQNVKDVLTAYTNDDCSIAVLKVIGIGRARVQGSLKS